MTMTLMCALALISSAAPAKGKWMEKAMKGDELYATMQTSEGDIVIKLFAKDAPKTVANFVGLATGEKDWHHPKDGAAMKGKSLYAGTVFHRVIDGFMIQGGDPLGTGTGGPGYRFEDEFQSGRKFDKVGILAMANSGPGSNGSQFFITVSTPAHLNNKHTIFGEVVKGYEVVEKIAKVPTAQGNRPVKPVILKEVKITDAAP